MPNGVFSSPRYISDKDAEYEAAEKKKTQKKISKNDLGKSVERLARITPRVTSYEPLLERKVIPKKDLDASVDRLFNQHQERKEVLLQNLEKKIHGPPPELPTLDQSSLVTSVDRLTNIAITKKKEQLEKLRKKHNSDPLTKQTGNKKLTSEEQSQCNDRAYSGPMNHRKETREKLEEKYISGTQRQFRTMGADEWKATIERLTS